MADTANPSIVQFNTVRKYETMMKNIDTHIFIIYEENRDNSYRIISTGSSTGEQLDLHL